MQKISRFLHRYEFWIPVLLGLFFVLITLPGISWGTPDTWHPDELILRVLKALEGNWVFDETNFDYPSLPKYVMLGVGKIVYAFGGSQQTVIIAARAVSVCLGGLLVGLVFWMVRLLGGGIFAGILAALLLISNSQMVVNARWAHNDMYVTFFVTLSVFALIKFSLSQKNRLWLYLSFFSAGLAASSKYNGGLIALTPVLIFLFLERKNLWHEWLRIIETLFIGTILSFLGYVVGTPKALLWMSFYLKRLLPAMSRHRLFGWQPDDKIGAVQQWVELPNFWGILLFVGVLLAFIYQIVRLCQSYHQNRDLSGVETAKLGIVVAILLLDLPILFTYHVQLRFFLPFAPLLAILLALLLEDVVAYLKAQQKTKFAYLLLAVFGVSILYAFLGVISVPLLLLNDARIPATEFITNLPAGKSVEYTYYPPSFPENHFKSVKSYPLIVIKYPDQELPENPNLKVNIGEMGVEERRPDYLVFDSFTLDRFSDPYLCSLHPLDCDFFERLETGETNYQLIATFNYSLPNFLPNPNSTFVNPTIWIYERIEEDG